MSYQPSPTRYKDMKYNRCGRSGLLLPAISLGLWHNFGNADSFSSTRAMVRTAFDLGITHFDLANNYGPPPGSAETNFGKILRKDLAGYRDELCISTKAGYLMWSGPYGDHGSRKYLINSLNQSLKRMNLEYVDIFYHHRPDPHTPLEETMSALDYAVRSGKAIYAGISNYPADETREAARILKELGTPCLIHQPSCSLFNRWIEEELLDVLGEEGIGCIAFSPLAQGLLTNRYLDGIPPKSRVTRPGAFLKYEHLTEDKLEKARKLNEIARRRNQSLAQMALVWVLNLKHMTSVVIGASSPQQIADNVAALDHPDFSREELQEIEFVLEDPVAKTS